MSAVGIAMALALTVVGANPAAPPALLALWSDGARDFTQVVRYPADGAPEEVARLRHRPGAMLRAAVLPGTQDVLVIADESPGPDLSWGASLFRVGPTRPPQRLATQVAHASRPLITASGRVFVERGSPGEPPSEAAARQGQLRVDALSIDEIHPETGERKTLYRTEGYTAFLAGSLGQELFVYRVSFQQAELLAIPLAGGEPRVVLRSLVPFARDFAVEAGSSSLLFSNLEPVSRRWQVLRLGLANGQLEPLAEGTHPALTPFPWQGTVALNRDVHGLALLGGPSLPPCPLGDGFDVLRDVSADGRWAAGVHVVPGQAPVPFVRDALTGALLPREVPRGLRVELAGFVEAP